MNARHQDLRMFDPQDVFEKARISPKGTGRKLLLSGYKRTGKSKIAKLVAKRGDFSVLGADALRGFFWEIEDYDLRLSSRLRVYTAILNSFPGDLIIEGDDFIFDNRYRPDPWPRLHMTIPRLLQPAVPGLEQLVVGNRRASPAAKLEGLNVAIVESKCWSSTMSSEARERFAHEHVTVSAALFEMCREQNIEYRDIAPATFGMCCEQIAGEICRRQFPL